MPPATPTTDPEAALAGTMLPLGDAKGTALALMVELLAAGLTGANYAAEASSFLDAEGPPPGTGQLIIAFDPDAFAGGLEHFGRLAGDDRGTAGNAPAGLAPARRPRQGAARRARGRRCAVAGNRRAVKTCDLRHSGAGRRPEPGIVRLRCCFVRR